MIIIHMKMNLEEVYTQNLITIDSNARVERAFDILRVNRIRHIPVIEDTKIIGIISDRDIQRAIRVEVQDYGTFRFSERSVEAGLLVRDVMSWPVTTIDVNTSLLAVTSLMIERKISAVLVSKNEKTVGILTLEDMLRVLRRLLDDSPADKHPKGAWSWLSRIRESESPVGHLFSELSSSGI